MRWWLALGGVVALSAGVAVAWNPALLAVAGAPALLAGLIRSSRVRLLWFVGGGLVVFQQSDSVGAPKLAYLAGTIVVTAVSSYRLARSTAGWLSTFKPLMAIEGIYLLVMMMSYIQAHSNGTPATGWVRDAFPYILLGLAPVIALDVAHDLTQEAIARLSAIIGLLAAIGFAADWLDRRGVSSLPFGKFLLGSGCLAALGMSTALAFVASARHPARWGIIAASIPAIMLTTGTRSIVVFAAAILGIVGRPRDGRIGVGKTLALSGAIGAFIYFLVPRLVGYVVKDPGWFDRRIQAATTVLTGGGAADASYAERGASYALAQDAWHAHPWLGTGPGYAYPDGAFTLDTPLITVAKLGVIGVLALLALLGSYVLCCRRSGCLYGVETAHTAGRAFLLVMVAFLPFGTPAEDKGFAFAVCLAVAGVAATARTRLHQTLVPAASRQVVPSDQAGLLSVLS
jgi:hypothetical protein